MKAFYFQGFYILFITIIVFTKIIAYWLSLNRLEQTRGAYKKTFERIELICRQIFGWIALIFYKPIHVTFFIQNIFHFTSEFLNFH